MTNNIITIDGLASSGKTTAGLRLANMLGYQFIDSGSIYRAGCLDLVRSGFPTQEAEITRVFKSMDLSFSSGEESYRVFLSGEDVTDLLGSPEITRIVPIVGSGESVRSIVRDRQRSFAEGKNIVVTGRDAGSEVFPDAQLKYYLTASAEVRAWRRFHQGAVLDQGETYEEILNEIKRRDHLDSTRTVSPSRIPDGASVIDTSLLSLGDVVDLMCNIAIEREIGKTEGKSFRSVEML